MHEVKILDDMIEQEIQDRIFQIRRYLPGEEILAQVAEEAAELGHAACKLRRALDKTNPTPVSMKEALENFYEEWADCSLAVQTLGVDAGVIQEIRLSKSHRWLKRLKTRKENGDELEKEDSPQSNEIGQER